MILSDSKAYRIKALEMQVNHRSFYMIQMTMIQVTNLEKDLAEATSAESSVNSERSMLELAQLQARALELM